MKRVRNSLIFQIKTRNSNFKFSLIKTFFKKTVFKKNCFKTEFWLILQSLFDYKNSWKLSKTYEPIYKRRKLFWTLLKMRSSICLYKPHCHKFFYHQMTHYFNERSSRWKEMDNYYEFVKTNREFNHKNFIGKIRDQIVCLKTNKLGIKLMSTKGFFG